jgi:ABC-type amino acid transport substrate-binding protein
MMRALIIRIMQLCTLLACGAAWAQTRLTTVDDLKDKRIAVLQGSARVDYVQKPDPEPRC